MSLLQRLAQHPGVYFGDGDGIESGPFVSRIEVTLLPNGGVAIDYEATRASRASSIASTRCSSVVPMGAIAW